MLRSIDMHWVEHLTAMQNLREGIGLHAYGQRDPLVMYKKEAHEMFGRLQAAMQNEIVQTIFHVAPASDSDLVPSVKTSMSQRRTGKGMQLSSAGGSPGIVNGAGNREINGGSKIGRNDQCPCGSGKKYKRCHGIAA